MPNAKHLAAALAISSAGLVAVTQHEGVRFNAYLDIAGIPTICVGSTSDVRLGMRASKAECDRRLRTDMSYAEHFVKQCVRVPITQNQYDAMASFVFNVGGSAFCKSTLLRRLNAGDYAGAAREFPRWSYAAGKYSDGLNKRRLAEQAVFLKEN